MSLLRSYYKLLYAIITPNLIVKLYVYVINVLFLGNYNAIEL